MKKDVYISVSTDPVQERQKVVEYAKNLQGIADFIHCDVKDGIFVSSKNFDADLASNINANCLTMLDVHLMCKEPYKMIDSYLKSGANIVTIHYEAFADKNQIISAVNKIKFANALCGIAIRPETEVKHIKMFLYAFDVVLVLGVEPGASGQKFIPQTLEKIKQLDAFRKENDYNYKIEVDGGVCEENAEEIINAGGDILVSGNFVFKAEDREEAINKLKNK